MSKRCEKKLNISGRLSTNNMSEDEIDFVLEKLNYMNKGELLRKAMRALYRQEIRELVEKEAFIKEMGLIIKEYDSITKGKENK